MDKQTIINKFLEDKDLQEHELVYWKHKVSNGFKLKKFMEDFLDYYDEQLKLCEVGVMFKEKNINRFEVIDKKGRSYTNWIDKPFKIETSLQDEGKTLKIFLNE